MHKYRVGPWTSSTSYSLGTALLGDRILGGLLVITPLFGSVMLSAYKVWHLGIQGRPAKATGSSFVHSPCGEAGASREKQVPGALLPFHPIAM